ncbi:hypothetical protein SAMN05443144_108125 [Fodinibius roseus]|uniref:Uncharacterized protein n=1 Tax=Fodinibius roseus TaxID=1194090 RepID=A0A1M5BHB6_9BACT|nr:hypothetical protein [Fodinibius roseus]SHF41816.1 hypothetical protein SAMN05443144_108125 [Fodinibius roseus]
MLYPSRRMSFGVLLTALGLKLTTEVNIRVLASSFQCGLYKIGGRGDSGVAGLTET